MAVEKRSQCRRRVEPEGEQLDDAGEVGDRDRRDRVVDAGETEVGLRVATALKPGSDQ